MELQNDLLCFPICMTPWHLWILISAFFCLSLSFWISCKMVGCLLGTHLLNSPFQPSKLFLALDFLFSLPSSFIFPKLLALGSKLPQEVLCWIVLNFWLKFFKKLHLFHLKPLMTLAGTRHLAPWNFEPNSTHVSAVFTIKVPWENLCAFFAGDCPTLSITPFLWKTTGFWSPQTH